MALKINLLSISLGVVVFSFFMLLAIGVMISFNDQYDVNIEETSLQAFNGTLINIQSNMSEFTTEGEDALEEIEITPTDDFSVRSTFQTLKTILGIREEQLDTEEGVRNVYQVQGQGIVPDAVWDFLFLMLGVIALYLGAQLFWRYSKGLID